MRLVEFLFGSRCWWPLPPVSTRLSYGRVELRPLAVSDWREWRALRLKSADFLAPWEPVWPEDYLSFLRFAAMVRRQRREWRQGIDYSFAAFLREDDAPPRMVGEVLINDIKRGASNKGTVCYWIGEPYAGRGIMTEAAWLACAFGFDVLRLHRLEACCMPRNEPSVRLLKRLGFVVEGTAREYILINGKWEDHLLWGKGKREIMQKG